MKTTFNSPGDCRVRFFRGGCSMQRIIAGATDDGSALVREITVMQDTRAGGCRERQITSLDFMEQLGASMVAWVHMPTSQFLQVEGAWDTGFHDAQALTPKPAQ